MICFHEFNTAQTTNSETSTTMKRISAIEFAEDLRQTDSASRRSAAAIRLGKVVRREGQFQPVWDAVGGAAGLASLMAEFSVHDVRSVCRGLKCTASSRNSRPERRAAFGELVKLLYDGQLDDRPLRRFYQDIVPACNMDVVQEWENDRGVQWTSSQLKALALGHRERREAKFLAEVFSPAAEDLRFAKEKTILGGNLALCEKVLSKLLASEGETRVPPDFMDEFAMRLLKRLLKKRFDKETRDRVLNSVVQCIKKHKDSLVDQLHVRRGSLIQYIIQRWNKDKLPTIKEHLVQILELFPNQKRRLSLDEIHQFILAPRRMSPEARYEVLRLVFLHIQGYGIDIEDGSEEGLAKLRSLPVEKDLWPAKIFFNIDIHNARPLFERLSKAHPNGDFLSIATKSKTVLKQTRSLKDPRRADVEIVRYLLIRKSQAKPEDLTWLSRLRGIVEDRRTIAQQSRDPQDRAFWAKSALNLSIAGGDLAIFRDTILWARRFNKDSLTAKELYTSDTLGTDEAENLLSAIPESDTPAAITATPVSVAKDVEFANRILVDLTETSILAVQEPSFDRYRWSSILGLPQAVVNRRMSKRSMETFNKITESSLSADLESTITETLWKPTMDVLIEIEALLHAPTAKALLQSSNVGVSGVYVLKEIPRQSSAMTAELAKFLLERMRVRLGPKRLHVQMQNVIDIVLRVADSDQPALACPFIRDLIMDGGENSSWHRQLINVKFLKSLPSKVAREFLNTMADAMRDKIREQNARPMSTDETKPRPSVIKVTTLKMMAQLLQNNLFIDAYSSCDILTRLLAEARHIDVKITIVSSLLSTMEVPGCSSQLRTRILDALEKYVVPVTAQPSERRPVVEADWEAASEDGVKLPEVGEEASIMDMLISQTTNINLKLEDRTRISQLIVEGLEQSAVNNKRWMKLFLSKNKFTVTEHLAVGPVRPNTLASVFKKCTEYMPASLFRLLQDTIIFNLNPSPEAASITKLVQANPDLTNSNAGRHWLRHYDNSGHRIFQLGLEDAAFALQRPVEEMRLNSGSREGITIRMVQDLVLSAAEKLVLKGDTEVLHTLVFRLCQRRFDGSEQWKSWRTNCIPLIIDIVAMIEAIRSDPVSRGLGAVEQVPRPIRMPNTTRLRIMALPIPYSSAKQSASAADVNAFISELSGFIDHLATRRLPYHEDFRRLKEEVLKAPWKADFPMFAFELGRLGDVKTLQEPALADYLRLELAGEFLTNATDPVAKAAVLNAQNMVREWKNCEAEGLAAIGASVEEKLEGQGKNGWFVRRATN